MKARNELVGKMGLETNGGSSEESGEIEIARVGDNLNRSGSEETRGWGSSWGDLGGQERVCEIGECPR